MKKSSNDFKVCSVTLNPIKRVASSKNDTHEIRVSLLFRHWREVCLSNPECLTQEDRYILWKEPFSNKIFEVAFVIKPENPDMVEGYITNALRTCKKNLPTYVSPGVLSFVIAKVSRCLRENVVFDKDLQGFRFELAAVVDVSTVVDVGRDIYDEGMVNMIAI
uniref:Uncharacterized protein n=1 Tax=Chenopodium quinoa TaxID=63459 RepID=A0A803MLN9_CHEQI